VEFSVRAGDRAAGLLAYEDAARHYARALRLLPMLEHADGEQRCAVLLRLGNVLWRAGDDQQARRSFEEAAAVASRLGAAEMLARAALGHVAASTPLGIGLIVTGMFGGQTTHIHLLEQALAALPEGDSPLRAQVLARPAAALDPRADQADHQAALRGQAVGMARRLDDPQALLVALYARHWAMLAPDLLGARLANAAEVLDVAVAVGDLELCDVAGVDAELEAMGHFADRIGQPFYQWRTANMWAMRAMLDGRLDEAERLARGALDIGGLRQSEYVTYLFEHVLLVAIRWTQGRTPSGCSQTRSSPWASTAGTPDCLTRRRSAPWRRLASRARSWTGCSSRSGATTGSTWWWTRCLG
jgi:eukaryotic-like serine/threonine-protein kinase